MAEEREIIEVNQILQLTNLEIPNSKTSWSRVPRNQITWSRVSLAADTWVCCRHDYFETTDVADGQKQSRVPNFTQAQSKEPHSLTVVNLAQNGVVLAYKSVAESARMNPIKPVVALKAGSEFQVYNIATRERLAQCDMFDTVVFWTWASSEVIAIVTQDAVFHWCLHKNNTVPELLFRINTRLRQHQIVAYHCDPQMRWHAIVGLCEQDGIIAGLTQLYSQEDDITQCFAAHAVYFAQYKLEGNTYPSTVLCVASRHMAKDNLFGKIHAVELGPHIQGNFALTCHFSEVKFTDETASKYDFPVSLQVSEQLGLLYMVTKYGYFYLCDLESAQLLCSLKISTSIIFTTSLNTATQGVIAINTEGKVLSIHANMQKLVNYVRITLNKPKQADRLKILQQRSSTSLFSGE